MMTCWEFCNLLVNLQIIFLNSEFPAFKNAVLSLDLKVVYLIQILIVHHRISTVWLDLNDELSENREETYHA